MIDVASLPEGIRKRIETDIEKHGEWAVQWMLILAPLWRMVDDLKPSDTDAVWASVALHTISFFSIKDPSIVHFRISRDFLQKKFQAECDDRAVDLLARELVKACGELFQYIENAEASKDVRELLKPAAHGDVKSLLLPPRDFLPTVIYEKEGCNLLDYIFSQYLKSIGNTGEAAAEQIIKLWSSRQKEYRDSGYSQDHRRQAWALWINKSNEGETGILSQFLDVVLVEVIWGDRCVEKWNRECRRGAKNVPALTQGVHPIVTRILSPKTEVQKIEDQFTMLHSGKIIATIPTIDPKLIPIIMKGATNLNSLYHHKLIRHECRAGFENWVQGKVDPRVLRFEGGCSEIAERLGIKNDRAIAEIKAILHAQAYIKFDFEDGSSGNLISLRNFRSRGCNRDDGIEIVLGTRLLPCFAFQEAKGDRLLIPVPALPPLVSSTNSYSGQALLQMNVMEEFSKHSIEFANTGSIEILEIRWNELAREAALSKSIIKLVLDRWTQDGDDGARFLIKVAPERYSLGESYKRESDFLILQGEHRKMQQKRAKKSVAVRNKKRNREK